MPNANEQLGALAADAALARTWFARVDAATSDADWNRRTNPNEWSVAECIAHLNLTAKAMVPLVERGIAEARTLTPPKNRQLKQTTIGRVLAMTMGPVHRVLGFKLGAIKTPPPFVPGSDLPRAAVVAEFKDWQAKVAKLIEESRDLSIDIPRIESPFRAGTFYDVYSGLIIIVKHEHRHLFQAERVLGGRA